MKTILLLIAFTLASCTVTTLPDGTQTRSADYNAWIEIVKLIQADDIPVAKIIIEEDSK